ncbi:SDR family oxidoreductase [Paracoccus sp. Z118]|uniref:SDR family oxidoreductase n=1 Tax=Paracoccus sp. Z118 TaxID=2851017 RepID=UPI001C2B83A6|nr:SDR family oxidoreductase [Paracoccus sp. Z118]MBV0893543.1 SDR family oxidoreductase [Paracoccus sp. Z118]
MRRLEGKTCVVSGAGAGIGRETALRFRAEGAIVHALDRHADGLSALSSEGTGISTHVVDLTDLAAVRAFHAGLPRLDVQFNCAGIVPVGRLADCDDGQWNTALAVNVTAAYGMMREAVALMARGGGGSIINMASVISSIGAAPDRFAYGASKAAVIGMTKSVALDYAGQGIRCNAICPSGVETPSMTARIDAMEDPAAARRMFSSRQPVGRMGTPAEIAELAVYLASDASAFMTGSTVVIDGGAKL